MNARVHHLDCATFRPVGAFGGRVTPPRMVAHCLLVERDAGLVLVDTGIGLADRADARRRLTAPFVTMMRPDLEEAGAAVSQVRALGHDPADVRDIVLTHLDLDHVGGIGDFPHARVHVHRPELDAARAQRRKDRPRYRPVQWAHGPQWVEHELTDGEEWRGFSAVTVLEGAGDEGADLLLIPLPGHTRGHVGVAVQRPSGGWFLHAGDAYFASGEKRTPPSCPPGLVLFQRLMQTTADRRPNAERLRELWAAAGTPSGGDVTMFCSHDPSELEALAGTTD